MAKLVLLRADGTAQDIRLDRERITIGRRPDNDVCLAQPAVSGEHAAIVTILSDSFLEDLGSTNGTRVNGTPIAKHFLRDLDEIDIGRQILVYVVDDSARIEAPPKRPVRPEDGPAREGGVRATSSAAKAGGPAPGDAAPAVPRDKRRTDGPAAVPGGSGNDGQRSADAATDGPIQPPQPTIAVRAEPAMGSHADVPAATEPTVKVLSGARSGRSIALTKHETLIGRAGLQVVALRRDAGAVRLVPVEGTIPPSVNGTPVAPDGQRLAAGDILEVAGARLEFVVPPRRIG